MREEEPLIPPIGLHRAIVIGGGIGGLTAALALHRQGIPVTVHERAASLEPVGAGLALAPNALRALDRLGVGPRLRALAAPHPAIGVRHPSGRWLARTSTAALEAYFGDPVAAVARAEVIAALVDALPEGTVRTGSPATVVDPGDDRQPAVVRTTDGDRPAALVVAADGIRSATRGLLFPEHPGPRYSGFTTWRVIVTPDRRPATAGEIWGPGRLVGIVPLADGRVYLYAATLAPAGARAAGEHAELQRLFGDWCSPVPQLFALADPDRVLRNDIWDLSDPLPAHHHGRVALLGDAAHAMSPFLGQGACQALEDAATLAAAVAGSPTVEAALARYDAARRPRSQTVARDARRAGRMGQQLANPLAVGLRNAAIRLTPPGAMMRTVLKHADWTPPRIAPRAA